MPLFAPFISRGSALALISCLFAVASNVVTAQPYETDDAYLDLQFNYKRWSYAQTPSYADIVICEGVIRYTPSLQPKAVCEQESKGEKEISYEPARFIQLADWLAQHGYKQASYVHIDDDHTLWVSILKEDDRVYTDSDFVDLFGHGLGQVFAGVGSVDSGKVVPAYPAH
ncbi:exported hypothetical protein [Pseudomonas veronii]|uniref:hypothetical protein n=1 Tax=Pseudomonas veronii TaxID=76761 RepID=UPI001776172E|nr:hypothetical protein [Pseudomonas veronii]CAD0266051.1 exported hypothetical protein [Pseudomonas veronii]